MTLDEKMKIAKKRPFSIPRYLKGLQRFLKDLAQISTLSEKTMKPISIRSIEESCQVQR